MGQHGPARVTHAAGQVERHGVDRNQQVCGGDRRRELVERGFARRERIETARQDPRQGIAAVGRASLQVDELRILQSRQWCQTRRRHAALRRGHVVGTGAPDHADPSHGARRRGSVTLSPGMDTRAIRSKPGQRGAGHVACAAHAREARQGHQRDEAVAAFRPCGEIGLGEFAAIRGGQDPVQTRNPAQDRFQNRARQQRDARAASGQHRQPARRPDVVAQPLLGERHQMLAGQIVAGLRHAVAQSDEALRDREARPVLLGEPPFVAIEA